MNIMDLFRGGQQNMLGGQPQQGGNMLAQPQQMPQAAPQQMPQPAQPGLLDRYHNFTASDRGRALNDFFTGLALGKTPQESLGYGAKLVAAGRAGREGDEKSQQQKNQTVQWLQSQGIDPQEAGLIANDPKVLADFLKQQFAPKADERTSAVKNYQFAKQQGYTGSFADWEKSNKGGTTINLPGQPAIGSIPQGYAASQDPITHEWSMKPIAGGPAAAQMSATANAQEAAKTSQDRNANIVVQDIDRALGIVKEHPNTTTGVLGGIMSNIPGTNAYDTSKLLDTVKANAGFDRLQAMRDASPTGGALGQVSEREMQFLQAAIGNLEQSQGTEQFQDNLKRVKNVYLDIIYGKDGGPTREKLGFQEQKNADDTPPASYDGDPDLWKFMAPEDRKLWQ